MKIFTLLVVPVFFLISISGQSKTVSDVIGKTDNITVTSKNMSEAVSSPKKYEAVVNYPVLSGMSNTGIQDAINKNVYDFVLDLKNNFVSEVNGWDYTGPVDTYSSFEMSYNAYYHSDGIYSLALGNYTYYQGAAHPNTITYALNYDLNTGAHIALSDLFVKGSDYAKILSQYSISGLEQKWTEMGLGNDYNKEWLQEGAGPEDINFKVFNITPTGLLITFDAYQVGPYAIGPQEVEVPYSELSSIIDKDGPLKPFVK